MMRGGLGQGHLRHATHPVLAVAVDEPVPGTAGKAGHIEDNVSLRKASDMQPVPKHRKTRALPASLKGPKVPRHTQHRYL